MTITVDVRPEVQAELARQAAECGIGIDAYAASLLVFRQVFKVAIQQPRNKPRLFPLFLLLR